MAKPTSRTRGRAARKAAPAKRGRSSSRASTAKPRRTPAGGADLSPAAAETRNHLLDAAEVEFGRFGFDGARLDRIAQSVGVKTPLIHHYFNGKEALYQAVVKRALEVVGKEIDDVLASFVTQLQLDPTGSAEEAMRIVGEALTRLTYRFYKRHERILAIMRIEERSGRSLVRGQIAEYLQPALGSLIALFERLRQENKIRSQLDPRHLLLSLLAMSVYPSVEPLLVDALWPDERGGDDLFLERRAREITSLAIRGLLPA